MCNLYTIFYPFLLPLTVCHFLLLCITYTTCTSHLAVLNQPHSSSSRLSPVLPETAPIHDQAVNKMIYVVSLAEFGAVTLQTLQEMKIILLFAPKHCACHSSRVAKHCPSRIVSLSAEAVEIIYALGAGSRIVGVTGFAVEPLAARRKPRVSGFSSVNYDKVDALKPDLIITFSDVQAEAAKELIRRGHTVLATNQRSLAEIFETILLIGRVIGRETQARKLADKMCGEIFSRRQLRPKRMKVYFEEWNDPFISGIRWVGELIEAAGGEDVFPELRNCPRAPDRVVTSGEIIRRQPDIIIASWCGKKANLNEICQRPGWNVIPAVCNGRIHEIKSEHILQTGPGLLKGFRKLCEIINTHL